MWRTVKLGDIAKVIAGQSPKGEHYNKEGRGTPFYQGKKDYGERYLKKPTVWTDVVTRLAEKDDILMSVRAPVGALNIATEQICIGRGLAAIRPTAEALHDYLFYSLLLISHQLEGSAGAIFNSINKKQIEEIDVPLPPLAEQQRIVAKLDAAFDEIDRAIEIAHQQMQQAHSIHQQKTDSVFGEISGDKKTLNDVCNLITCGVAARPEYVEEGIPFLSAQNVKKGQVIYSNHKYITQEKHQELTKKNKPMRGDLLYTRVGSFGEAAVVASDIEFSIFVSLTLIKTNNELNPYYLKHYLNSQRLKTLASNSLSGSGVGNLNVGTVRKFPITLPSIEQQLEVVESLNDLADSTQRLYETYQRKAAQLQSLKSAILAQELQPPQSEAA